MLLKYDTTVSEVIDVLKQDVHSIQYNMLPYNKAMEVKRKDSAFGRYIHILQGGQTIASLKCADELESFVVAKNLVSQALRQLGYEVKTEEGQDLF